MNFERSLENIDDNEVDFEEEDEDDEEIKRLQSEIRRRRNEKRRRKQFLTPTCLSDGQTDTLTTDQSASPGYSDIDHDNTDQVGEVSSLVSVSSLSLLSGAGQ